MKLANLDGRATILAEGGGIDLERASGGRLGPDVQALYDDWDEVREFAAGLGGAEAAPFDEAKLGSPVPAPRQVFAIGLNYRSHAEESGMDGARRCPATFTKFPASLPGPFDDVELAGRDRRLGGRARRRDRHPRRPGGRGRRLVARRRADGRPGHLGAHRPVRGRQPVLARASRTAASGRWARGWSPPTSSPIPTTSRLGCSIDGVTVQDARTSDLIFSVPRLVAELSAVLPLLPGDVIFTGTPAGVGITSKPPRFLQAGEVARELDRGHRHHPQPVRGSRRMIPTSDVDLFGDEALAEPYEHYRALRDLGPVVWLERHEVYAVPRYADVRATLADAATFCSGQGVGLNEFINHAGRGTTLMSDGATHDRQREVIGRPLTPKALAELRPDVQALADDLVDRLLERGSFDAVGDLAEVIPVTLGPRPPRLARRRPGPPAHLGRGQLRLRSGRPTHAPRRPVRGSWRWSATPSRWPPATTCRPAAWPQAFRPRPLAATSSRVSARRCSSTTWRRRSTRPSAPSATPSGCSPPTPTSGTGSAASPSG